MTYLKFIFEKFETEHIGNDLEIRFFYALPPDHNFVHKIILEKHSESVNDILVFNLGLVEMFSYWKLACSPIIEVQAGFLTTSQAEWWKKLLIKGMGEYFYKNNIDFTKEDFVQITSVNTSPLTPLLTSGEGNTKSEVLIPLGGGKDSAVTLEILKKHFSVVPVIVQPASPAALEIAKTAGFPNPIIIKRILDPHLLELNKQGFLNGHVPYSASLAFIFLLLGFDYITVSNERSSDEGNVMYLGHEINHQYSKSLEFETDLNTYITKNLKLKTKYFSFLRPLYELQIGKLFSIMPQFFSVFRSCNKNQQSGSWCGHCAKCIATALVLLPWVGEGTIKDIVGINPVTDPSNKELLAQITDENKVKPFECVLTRAEAQGKIDMDSWLDNPNMPTEFAKILKDAYDHT